MRDIMATFDPRLAEYILRAAPQGRTTYRELVAAAGHATARRTAGAGLRHQ
jgi:hypothetical protein